MISLCTSSRNWGTLRATHVELTKYAAINSLQNICLHPRWQLTWQSDASWELAIIARVSISLAVVQLESPPLSQMNMDSKWKEFSFLFGITPKSNFISPSILAKGHKITHGISWWLIFMFISKRDFKRKLPKEYVWWHLLKKLNESYSEVG